MWIEEAYEVMKEEDFDMLDESIRGECPNKSLEANHNHIQPVERATLVKTPIL